MMTGNTNGVFRNNPGNIRVAARAADRWRGVSGEPGELAHFDTMANGIRAHVKQLLAYVDGYRKSESCIGYKDPDGEWRGFVPIFAPPIENPTDKYVAYVAERCELDPRAILNLREFSTAYWITRAMEEFENGRDTFEAHVSEEDLQSGVREGLA